MSLDFSTERLKYLAELLLGVAHSDGSYDGEEAEEIADILRTLAEEEEDELPEEVSKHLAQFDVDDFSIEATCDRLGETTREERRKILQLVVKVADADDVHDFAESDYIRDVGKALGAEEDEYADLTIEVLSIEETATPPMPPPTPSEE